MRQASYIVRILVTCFIASLLGACSTGSYPPAPASATAAPNYKYIIGPLDTVNIVVWRNPELTTSVPVRPDGLITTPLAEDVQAIGRSPSELARDIEKSLANTSVIRPSRSSSRASRDRTTSRFGSSARRPGRRPIPYRHGHDVARRDDPGRRPDGLRER